jgi:hypothetical protein
MPEAITKLYSAYSVVNDFHDRDNVNFVWFVRSRQTPLPDTAALVKRFDDIKAASQRRLLDRRVQSLFSESEVKALQRYLAKTHDAELFVRKIDLPLKDKDLPALFPMEKESIVADTGLYLLAQEKSYALPFEVWAFYDLRQCPFTAEAQARQKARLAGVRFMRAALRRMNLDQGISDQQIDAAVAPLFESHGFNVTQQGGIADNGRPAPLKK